MYEIFWVRVVSLVSLIECVPRYPGGTYLLIDFEFHRLCLFRSKLTGEIIKLHIVIGAKSKTKRYTIHKV